jgi:hypothetical protein
MTQAFVKLRTVNFVLFNHPAFLSQCNIANDWIKSVSDRYTFDWFNCCVGLASSIKKGVFLFQFEA